MTGPERFVSPSVREIAALTARLRELSGRAAAGVDPALDAAERAAFIADKNDLIARITTSAANERSAAAPTGPSSLVEAEQQEERREQLGRWHDDDVHDGESAGEGQELVCDDAPGLP